MLRLAIPILKVVTALHRYLALCAPSNLLVRRVRSSPPRWRDVMLLTALAVSLIVAVRVMADAAAAGAPGWLNGGVLILAWDAIKFALLGLQVVAGLAAHAIWSSGRLHSGHRVTA